MNISTSTSPSAATEATACDRPRAAKSGATEAGSEAFERALRDRAARSDVDSCFDDTSEDEAPPAIDAGAIGGFAPRAETPRAAPASTPPTSSATLDSPGATRAALETALANTTPVAPVMQTGEVEQGWQISLNEPGAALEVKAMRLPQGLDARAVWTLTIASPALTTDAMARHLPHLSERLRMRGIDTAHVRIEESDQRGSNGKDGKGGGSGR